MNTTNYRAIIPLLLIIVIDTMGVGIFFPVLSPLFMSRHGLLPVSAGLGERDLFYGLMLGLFSLFMFLSSPVLGDLSDQIGRKKVLLICLFGTALSSGICAISIQYHLLLLLVIGRVLGGMMAGCQAIASAVIMDVSPENKKTANLGLISLSSCIGFMIGPLLGGLFSNSDLVHWFSYATPFWVDALLALLNGSLLFLTFNETFKNEKPLQLNWQRQIAVYVDAVKHSVIFKLSLALLCSETAWALYFQFMPIYLVQHLNNTSQQIGYFMSFIGLMMGITFLFFLRIALKHFHDKDIVKFGITLAFLGLFISLIFKSIVAIWILGAVISVGGALAWSPFLSLFSKAVSEDQQGWAMGVSLGVSSLGWIPGIILTSVLDYINPSLPFLIASIFMALSFWMITKVSKIIKVSP